MAMNAYVTEQQPPLREPNGLIKEYIILSYTLAAVKRNRLELDKKARSLRPLFIQAASIVVARIEADLALAEQLLRSMHIDMSIDVPLMPQERLNAEINNRISFYVTELFSKKQ
ncbi:hypothetical protein [Paenibacillus sp. YIM B09110]|uniref:hypothetical protein n=1 Tax=Paenibacillus sp. YIM B09110 TaxID=3126102 RepID=UPI00301D93F8